MSKTPFQGRNLLYFDKALKKLKSAVKFTIRLHSVDWAEIEMATEVRGDSGNILAREAEKISDRYLWLF